MYYFNYNSVTRKNIAEILFNNYDVTDVSIIMSKIDYVERNEPRRYFFNIF